MQGPTIFRRKARFPFVLSLMLSSTMAVVAQVPGTVAVADAAASTTHPAQPDPLGDGNFLARLGRFYAKDWAGTLPASPTPARRGVEAPLDSPRFPMENGATTPRP